MRRVSSSGGDLSHIWRQTLRLESGDVREKALRHHRFDLWYGDHHLRFTRTDEGRGRVVLRLEERARLRGPQGAGPRLLAGPSLSSPFIYQETVRVPHGSAGDAAVPSHTDPAAVDSAALSRGCAFFDRAAALLDRLGPADSTATSAASTPSATARRTATSATHRRKAG